MDIVVIAQGLIDKLEADRVAAVGAIDSIEAKKQGIVMLFEAIRDAAAALTPVPEAPEAQVDAGA